MNNLFTYHTCQSVIIVVLYIEMQSGKTDKQTEKQIDTHREKKRIVECQQQQAMLCYERVLFAIYILSLFTVLLLRR